MPDVTRSDSQRSDASHKPRVSFNRDVHVKRIGREGVVSALARDGEGHLVPLPVRRERPHRLSRRQMELEAEAVLRQADRAVSTTDKFSTLPHRPKHAAHPAATTLFHSLDRRGKKPKAESEVGGSLQRRRFSSPDARQPGVGRSASDAGKAPKEKKEKDRGSSIFGTLERFRTRKKPPPLTEAETRGVRADALPPIRKKKQLSPIIESPAAGTGGPWFESAGAPTPRPEAGAEEAVVYAEVVARPDGRKRTVHTQVPAAAPNTATTRPHTDDSEEDEGVDMGVRVPVGGAGRRGADDIREDTIINMLRSRSNPLLDEELAGGAGGFSRREVRTERVIRVEGGGSDDPDGRGRADGADFGGKRRASRDLYEESPIKSDRFFSESKSYEDGLDRSGFGGAPVRAWTPPLETSLIDSNDLSYRRERLESRLSNQRRRFPSSAHELSGYRESKMADSDLRKNFLISQLEDKSKGYFEKKIATEIDTHRLLKKELFADSGVELSDYRKEPSKEAALNHRNLQKSSNVRVTRTSTTETSGGSSRARSTPALHHNNHNNSHNSYATDYNSSDGERRYKGDISSRFIEEERRRRTEPSPMPQMPASSTLVQSAKHSEGKTKEKKMTRMDKVKQLMFGGGKKKKKKGKDKDEVDGEGEGDPLKSRYTEYRGSDVSAGSSPAAIHRNRTWHHQTSSSEMDDQDVLSSSGSRQRLASGNGHGHGGPKSEETWFKSLSRRNNKHASRGEKKPSGRSVSGLGTSDKHLRFFGDSDQESVRAHRTNNPHLLQVPGAGASNRRAGPVTVDSSAESTAEGDSGHSKKSVVYLHAATVGDIPGSSKVHRSVLGLSASREELGSNPDQIGPHSRTLSRSVSVLAPWRPRMRQEVNYDTSGRPPRPPGPHKRSTRDLRKSKENLDQTNITDTRPRGRDLVFTGKSSTLQRAKQSKRDLARSVSIPKDSRVSSGWFRGGKGKA